VRIFIPVSLSYFITNTNKRLRFFPVAQLVLNSSSGNEHRKSVQDASLLLTTRIKKMAAFWDVASSSLVDIMMMMEAASSSEKRQSIFTRLCGATLQKTASQPVIFTRRRENLKSHKKFESRLNG
jgi:hypothetical protein